MRVAFAGLGVMGYPMAGYLAAAGHEVTVYNRTTAKSDAWLKSHKGTQALTPADAARNTEVVFCCVGNDEDVRAVILGKNGILASIASGSVIVDHTTASATVALEVSDAAKKKGVDFLDAPLSGGQAGAESGKLTIMVGGDEPVFNRVLPVMNCYAKACTLIGPVGSGQKAKMVNQICIAGILQGLAEALVFSQHAGLDSAAVVQVISQGAAQSWQMDNRYQTMLAQEYEHGFAVDWMRKDLAMVLEQANRMSLSLPVTALVDGYYAQIQGMGGGRWDTSSLLARMQRLLADGSDRIDLIKTGDDDEPG
jgi:3-hydroxyisobutyrate dehydrogenase-like beta-hydroxyacid dehydrogenase